MSKSCALTFSIQSSLIRGLFSFLKIVTAMNIPIIEIRIAGWWLSLGVRKGAPFVFELLSGSLREIYLRLLWLELGIGELPY